ncbi:hypothetical protein BDR03DRAFT_125621 [Suillus americanus]|nr:hypothetical protein BDR03DRAFT_125621 [Suillus americanus]
MLLSQRPRLDSSSECPIERIDCLSGGVVCFVAHLLCHLSPRNHSARSRDTSVCGSQFHHLRCVVAQTSRCEIFVYWELTESEPKDYISIDEHVYYVPISYIAADYVYPSAPEDNPLSLCDWDLCSSLPPPSRIDGRACYHQISKAPTSSSNI